MTINWEQVINNITIVNKEVGQEAQAHINNLTKPLGSLGDLERVAVTIAEITGEKFPDIFPPLKKSKFEDALNALTLEQDKQCTHLMNEFETQCGKDLRKMSVDEIIRCQKTCPYNEFYK